jgi:hypothetical protein
MESSNIRRPNDGLFKSMRIHIADMQCSSAKKQKLASLVAQTQESWARILNEPDSPDRSPSGSPQFQLSQNERNDRQSPLSILIEDLGIAFTQFAENINPKRVYHLHQEYEFKATLGHCAPIRIPICVSVNVSENPERVFIKFPGYRSFAVQVGTCAQYDSDIFFGESGKIYLVEQTNQASFINSEGYKVFDADEVLETDWRTLH